MQSSSLSIPSTVLDCTLDYPHPPHPLMTTSTPPPAMLIPPQPAPFEMMPLVVNPSPIQQHQQCHLPPSFQCSNAQLHNDVTPFDTVPPCDDCMERARYQGSYGSQCQGQPGTECALSNPNTPIHSNQSTLRRRSGRRSSLSSNAGGRRLSVGGGGPTPPPPPPPPPLQVAASDPDCCDSEVVETVESSV